MPTPLEANAAAFLAVAVVGIAAIMAGVSALSWRRLRHPRLALVAGGFLVLAVQGALAAWAASQGRPDLAGAGLDFLLVVLLYLSVAAR